jgi:hypothetical protein
MANPYARKYLIKKCPHVFSPVWERTIVSESEWFQLFQRWNHVQLEHVKIDNSYDCLLTKENVSYDPCMHQQFTESAYLFWLSRNNLL